MRLLTFRIEAPYWCDFRDPSGVNVHRTFPVPPPTALVGLIGNALGLPQEDFSLFDETSFAIRILERGELIEDYWNLMKRFEVKTKAEKRSDERAARIQDARVWARTQVIRQRLVRPAYRIFVSSKIPARMTEIRQALEDPSRPLYLGGSDDLVVIDDIGFRNGVSTRRKKLDSIVPGMHPGGELVNLPIRFRETKGKISVVRLLVTVAMHINLQSPIPAVRAGDDIIAFLQAGQGKTQPVAKGTQS